MKTKNYFWILSVLFFLGSILFYSCSGAFQGKIYMTSSGSSIGSLGDFFQKDEQEEALGSPKEMNVSKGLFANKIEISWSPVKNANAYRLERAIVTETDENRNPVLPKDDDFKPLNATEIYYKTSYTDIILSEDETYTSQKFNNYYFYRVCALKTGLETDEGDYFPNYSEKNDASTVEGGGETAKASAINDDFSRFCGYLFKAPAKIEADKGKDTDGIWIRWSSVVRAYKYKISRSETQNGFYYPIKEIMANENSFYDEIAEKYQGDEYYYKISAINSYGNTSLDSAVAMGYTRQYGAPAAPDNVHVEDGLGTSVDSLVVKWEEVDGDNIEADTVTYSLYRNTSTDSTYNLIKNNIPIDETTYEDKKVSPGVYYYYYVQTIAEKKDDKEKIKSPFSETGKDSQNPAYGFLVTSPTSVEIEDGSTDDTVKIRWTPAMNVIHSAGDEEIEEVEYDYNIYYDEDQDGQFLDKIENLTRTENAGKFEVECEKHKFFKVVTVNSDKQVESNRVTTEKYAPVPNAPTNIIVSKTIGLNSAKDLINQSGWTFSEDQWVANANGVYPVVITWDAPSDGASGYNIFRSTSASSNFKKINNSIITAKGYVDTNSSAKPGVFYYYKVTSLNALGQGTKSNDPAVNDPEHKQRGYGALTLDAWYGEYNENIARSQSKLTLMHKSNNLDKVGSETKDGDIAGNVYYSAKVQGLGAYIIIQYTNYIDYFISDDPALGVKFVLNGNTDTESDMSANGSMKKTVNLYSYCLDLTSDDGSVFDKLSADKKQKILDTKDTHYLVGMYPASVVYDKVEIKSGNAGGGYYYVTLYEIDGCKRDGFGTAKVILEGEVGFKIGNDTFNYHTVNMDKIF